MKNISQKTIERMQFVVSLVIMLMILLLIGMTWMRGLDNLEPIFIVNIAIETTALAGVSILYFSCRVDDHFSFEDMNSRYFIRMLMTCGMGLFADACCWLFDGVASLRYGVIAANTIYYLVGSITIYFFWQYLVTYLNVDNPSIRRGIKIMKVMLYLNNAMVILNLFTGFYFTVDAAGVYHRESGFIYSQIYMLYAFFSCLAFIIIQRKNLTRLELQTLLSYLFAPYLVQLLTIGFYGLSLSFPMIYCETLIIYSVMSVQSSRKQMLISRDLKLATDIQENALPNVFPAFPKRKEVDLYALMTPAKEVGGDFYDFFEIGDDRVALVIADVSGKGIPAALFMMIAKTLIKNEAQSGDRTPSEILAAVSNTLCENNTVEFFVTAWLGILDLSTGHLVTASAGHEYPMLSLGSDEYVLFKDKHGLPLASMEGMTARNYRLSEFDMTAGDKIFVYTDGIAEAINITKEQYGTERMIECLNQHSKDDPETTIHAMWDSLQAFVKDEPQFDDVTMLCVEYRGK